MEILSAITAVTAFATLWNTIQIHKKIEGLHEYMYDHFEPEIKIPLP